MSIKRYLLLLLCLLPLFTATAASTSQHQKELQQLDQQIASTQHIISDNTKKRDQLQQQLKKVELDIAKLSQNIKHYDQQLKPLQQQLTKLEKQQTQLQTTIANQRQALANQLRSAYTNHQENYVKVLLNQQNVSHINRMMTYYQYYTRARLTLINDVNRNLQQLQQVSQTVTEKRDEIQQLRQQQVAQQKTLINTENQRKSVIRSLNRSIVSNQQRLQQLQKNKQALQSVIDRLQRQQTNPNAGKPFASLKGKLSWPMNGRISRNFGSRENQQSLPLQGVLMRGKSGQNIQAIADGKVVYADWLRGFGLLIIVDHGDGYMTLYAHCNSLYRKVGDNVQAGSLIASVGNSGGLNQTALLFQIRHKGVPQNPRHWCK